MKFQIMTSQQHKETQGLEWEKIKGLERKKNNCHNLQKTDK